MRQDDWRRGDGAVDPEEWCEELRVLYVAITRAIFELHLTMAEVGVAVRADVAGRQSELTCLS